MGKKIIAVNAGPRKGWNTDTLINEAVKGAESAGATVEKFDLFRLEKYTGCISCFGCKREKNKGHCVCKDGLTPVLDAIREADDLIIRTVFPQIPPKVEYSLSERGNSLVKVLDGLCDWGIANRPQK